MKQVITSQNIPIKIWTNNIEQGAIDQAKNMANLPSAYKWIAIMPDSHQGYGMPIGGVLATQEIIIPNAVGVDIGCGMCVVKSTAENVSKEKIKEVMGLIRKAVPVGFNWHKESQAKQIEGEHTEVITPQLDKAKLQLGTLGGGNHFIEIQEDEEGYLYIMIHSGSRNLGKTTADHYNKLSIGLNEKWHSEVPKSWELAFLPLGSQEAKDYIKDMNFCLDFALANRMMMMQRSMDCVSEVLGCEWGEILNEPHNYATWENHFGKNVIVHRKGATSAKEGELGMIPGSQGTNSYIVKGKGNTESFMSCSHGSGRLMGRNEARRTLSIESELEMLEEQDIVHSIRNQKDLDEAPSSYKDIEEVMANQEDLVDIEVKLKPRGVIKG